MKAINQTKNIVVVDNLEIADTIWSRMKGLLGRSSLFEGDGLLITHCNSIHMFFMRFSLDVLFLDHENRIVGLVNQIPPGACSPVFWKAVKAIEMKAGTIERTGTSLGDQVVFSAII